MICCCGIKHFLGFTTSTHIGKARARIGWCMIGVARGSYASLASRAVIAPITPAIIIILAAAASPMRTILILVFWIIHEGQLFSIKARRAC
jgi:hypothetical protein